MSASASCSKMSASGQRSECRGRVHECAEHVLDIQGRGDRSPGLEQRREAPGMTPTAARTASRCRWPAPPSERTPRPSRHPRDRTDGPGRTRHLHGPEDTAARLHRRRQQRLLIPMLHDRSFVGSQARVVQRVHDHRRAVADRHPGDRPLVERELLAYPVRGVGCVRAVHPRGETLDRCVLALRVHPAGAPIQQHGDVLVTPNPAPCAGTRLEPSWKLSSFSSRSRRALTVSSSLRRSRSRYTRALCTAADA